MQYSPDSSSSSTHFSNAIYGVPSRCEIMFHTHKNNRTFKSFTFSVPRRHYDTVIKEPMRTSSLKTDMAFLGGILKTEMYMVDVNVAFQLSPNKEHEMQCTVVPSRGTACTLPKLSCSSRYCLFCVALCIVCV